MYSYTSVLTVLNVSGSENRTIICFLFSFNAQSFLFVLFTLKGETILGKHYLWGSVPLIHLLTIFKVWQFSEKVLRVKQTRIKSAWKLYKRTHLCKTLTSNFSKPQSSPILIAIAWCWHHLSVYFWPIVWCHVAVVSILLWGIPLNYLGQASPPWSVASRLQRLGFS